MGTFAIWHWVILDLLFVPLFSILVCVIKPMDVNRFGEPAASLRLFEAIIICFKKFGDFSGRAKRSEFWWFFVSMSLPD